MRKKEYIWYREHPAVKITAIYINTLGYCKESDNALKNVDDKRRLF